MKHLIILLSFLIYNCSPKTQSDIGRFLSDITGSFEEEKDYNEYRHQKYCMDLRNSCISITQSDDPNKDLKIANCIIEHSRDCVE